MTLPLLIVAGCNPWDGEKSLHRCAFFDVNGETLEASKKSYRDPVGDAVAVFEGNGLTVAVVRNRKGHTVTPLIREIDPEFQEVTDENYSRATDMFRAVFKAYRDEYRLAFLQDDVITKAPPSKTTINFMDVKSPCFRLDAYDYASVFNTEMLRLASERRDVKLGIGRAK